MIFYLLKTYNALDIASSAWYIYGVNTSLSDVAPQANSTLNSRTFLEEHGNRLLEERDNQPPQGEHYGEL